MIYHDAMLVADVQDDDPRGEDRLDGWPDEVLGTALEVPVLGGGMTRYSYLDNAASTPPLTRVANAVAEFSPWYSSVHRGAGYKSRVATAAYEEARCRVARFVNAGDGQVTIFVKNTTEGINRIARLAAGQECTVFLSVMEHHANMLPWRANGARLLYVQADRDGVLDEDHLRQLLSTAPSGKRIVALAGAYNVSGYTPPIHRLARMAHEAGAEILVDGAQLAPHRRVDLRGSGAGEEIDYFVFSGHKIYAPYGSGALIAPMAAFAGAAPDLVGGGAVDLVTLDEVVWTELPDREEAGSPNVIGAVALGAAVTHLDALGRERLECQESALTAHALRRLAAVPGLRVLGPGPGPARIGVISFAISGIDHGAIAAALSFEHGIGVRNGCFCAHPGVVHLLDLAPDAVESARRRLRRHERTGLPGAVRVSLGLQNTRAEIDRLADALASFSADDLSTRYVEDPSSGEFRPRGWTDYPPPRLESLLTGWS